MTVVYEALEAKINELGSGKAASKFFRVSEPYLSQVRSNQRAMPERIAAMLGYRLEWVKIDE
jgi:hypothetical protein